MFYIEEKDYDTWKYVYPKFYDKYLKLKSIHFRKTKFLMNLRLARLLIRKFDKYYIINSNQSHKKQDLVIKYG